MADNDKELMAFLSTEARDPAKPLLRVGGVVGNWRILSLLGGGGFGEVYRVEHTHVGIVCALKILKRDTENARTRFKREVTFVAGHSCVGVPRFYEVGEFHGGPYFVMEMLTPRELPTTDREIAVLLKTLCLIVAELHKEGFVHRDIKPANILYRGNGDVVLVDYGLIAKEDKSGGGRVLGNKLTRANVAVGTERFAAPEQFSGSPIDCHADIHALGVLIETCFHGQLPRRWRRIVCRATSSLPEQRYSSCNALSRAIAFRFVGEFAVVLLVIVSVALITLAIAFAAQASRLRDGVVPVGSSANSDNPVKGKNVSDAAEEWLVP